MREATVFKRALSAHDIEDALGELGKLAAARGESLDLLLVGGAALVLRYGFRPNTYDVDGIWSAQQAALIRALAAEIGAERHWPKDWLNDGAKGFLAQRDFPTSVVFSSEGITVRIPEAIHLLALKLSAWRDPQDRRDARQLLEVIEGTDQRQMWEQIKPYVVPGRELKARYAFDETWELVHGQDQD